MANQTRNAHTTLRAAPRVTCTDPVEDRYVDLVVAIFRRAKSDLSHPGYRSGAQQWLRSPHAAWYASLLGVSLPESQLIISTANTKEPRHG